MPEELGAPQQWVIRNLEQRVKDLKESQDAQFKEIRQNLDLLLREFRQEERKSDARASLISYVQERVAEHRVRLDSYDKAMKENVVLKEEFRPYRNGIISLIVAVGMTVLTGVLNLVIKSR